MFSSIKAAHALHGVACTEPRRVAHPGRLEAQGGYAVSITTPAPVEEEGAPEDVFNAPASAPGRHDRQVAGLCAPERLPVERPRDARDEVRLADEVPPPPRDLDDELVYTRRKRRSVRPEPAAPSSRPAPIRISAFSSNESA